MLGITVLLSLVSLNYAIEDRPPLYEEPIAQKVTTDSSIILHTQKYDGEKVAYLSGNLGKTLSVINLDLEGGLKIQFGLQVSTWFVVIKEDDAFPLLTQDFYFSFPVYFKYGNISFGAKFNHISAHLGDGMDRMLERNLGDREKKEFEEGAKVAERSGYHLSLMGPEVYSRDFLSFHFAHETTTDFVKYRVYGEIQYAHQMHPDDLKRWRLDLGVEAFIGNWVLAHNTAYQEDVSTTNLGVHAGYFITRKATSGFDTRLCLTWYKGADYRGQLYDRKLNQLGLGIVFR
jgi:hypothetical protein